MKRETSKFRHLFLKYCKGDGLDLGHGTDPITKSAITVDDTSSWLPVDDGSVEYREMCSLNLKGDAKNLKWFKDSCMDFIYSSHLLEDFTDKASALIEWKRVLKTGGYLMLLLPNEKRYREQASEPNPCHQDPDFSLETVKSLFSEVGIMIIESAENLNSGGFDYNFMIVGQKP